jgi:orotate phosphoribosyltransferase
MTEADVIKLLETKGAILTGVHVVYTSGKHGGVYINKDALYPDTDAVSALCREFAERFAGRGVQVVAAPAIGGVALSQWTAHHLGKALAVYAEKQPDGSFVFRRGYDKLLAGRRTLLVEDILTTGGSLKAVIEAARAAGAEVVGAAAICNRGGVTAEQIGIPGELIALANFALESWNADECPLCARGMPIDTNVGKGRSVV